MSDLVGNQNVGFLMTYLKFNWLLDSNDDLLISSMSQHATVTNISQFNTKDDESIDTPRDPWGVKQDH